MANYNEHICMACGKVYEYCSRCVITPVVHHAEGFCSEECARIFNTLSKHGCGLTTAEETLAELGNIDVKIFNPSMQAHIDALKAEVKPAPIEEIKETPVVETVFSKKKKW